MDIKFRKMLPEDVYVVSGMEKQMFGTCTNAELYKRMCMRSEERRVGKECRL